MSELRLIVFDLGRVLVRICDDWRHACEIAGVRVGPLVLDEAGEAAVHQVVCDAEVGRIHIDEFCRRLAPLLRLERGQVRAMSDVYLRGMYPGVIELIEQIHAAGLGTACMSNTNENHWRIMLDPGSCSPLPLHRLTYAFASHLAGHRKPDEGFYAHVERVTGFGAGQILFFDDMEENVAAARRRGWNAELILHDGDPLRQLRGHLWRLGVLGSPG